MSDDAPELTKEQRDELRKLVSRLPRGLRSDWQDTNHFELTDGSDDYFWLDLSELVYPREANPCESELGRRVGLMMDLAAWLSANGKSLLDAADERDRLRESPVVRKAIAEALGLSWPPSSDGFCANEERGPIHVSDLYQFAPQKGTPCDP